MTIGQIDLSMRFIKSLAQVGLGYLYDGGGFPYPALISVKHGKGHAHIKGPLLLVVRPFGSLDHEPEIHRHIRVLNSKREFQFGATLGIHETFGPNIRSRIINP